MVVGPKIDLDPVHDAADAYVSGMVIAHRGGGVPPKVGGLIHRKVNGTV
jgi:hypothetical protein